MLIGVLVLTGCSSEPDEGSDRACGILDATLVEEATGQAEFSNFESLGEQDRDGSGLLAIGQPDDGSPRMKFDCTITDRTSHAYLQIGGRSTVSDADRDDMLTTFRQSATRAGCEERSEEPLGFVCTEGATTTTGLMFTDRWVRVTAEAKQGSESDATISPELVLEIAENINANLG